MPTIPVLLSFVPSMMRSDRWDLKQEIFWNLQWVSVTFSGCSLTPCETAISMEWSWTPSVGVSLRNSILTLKSRWRALKLRIAGIFMIWQSATFRSATIRFLISPMISWGSLFITIFSQKRSIRFVRAVWLHL